ncbi:MAG TPA: hypothetical protein DGH25_01015 [Erwiniaceae bacterium]|uniref:Transposase n=1 Tax=Mixta calida TaxID=665913 RepID=A0ABM6S553_9GAMM|nr:hypothetical protein C2E16_18730 [Mixta calida]KAF0857947.1 hypothetical protein Y888_19135 [Mixta calida B021323]ORM57943.1 hypothetical protein HA40_12640 [Mixta calida]HCW45996.1 hypothetical protein [Erwiniaceae bacterium]
MLCLLRLNSPFFSNMGEAAFFAERRASWPLKNDSSVYATVGDWIKEGFILFSGSGRTAV